MSQPKYMLYPSVLGKFLAYLNVDEELEAPWNIDSEGNYKVGPDEMADKLLKELLDCINRVPQEPSEAATAGTCLNEVVDRLILNTRDGNKKISVSSSNVPERCVRALMDGFEFFFNYELCKKLRAQFWGCVPQYRCEAILPTKYGDVLLYGDVDYIGPGIVYDLKTTSKYDYLKYGKGVQHLLYPYCLLKSGDALDISMFRYYVVQWVKRKDQPWDGYIYTEDYSVNLPMIEERLRGICEHFIEFLETHRDRIHNKKIFGEV